MTRNWFGFCVAVNVNDVFFKIAFRTSGSTATITPLASSSLCEILKRAGFSFFGDGAEHFAVAWPKRTLSRYCKRMNKRRANRHRTEHTTRYNSSRDWRYSWWFRIVDDTLATSVCRFRPVSSWPFRCCSDSSTLAAKACRRGQVTDRQTGGDKFLTSNGSPKSPLEGNSCMRWSIVSASSREVMSSTKSGSYGTIFTEAVSDVVDGQHVYRRTLARCKQFLRLPACSSWGGLLLTN